VRGLRAGRSEVRLMAGTKICLLFKVYRPALGLTQANIQQGSGNLSQSYSIQGVKLTVLLCIVPSYHICSFCNGKLGKYINFAVICISSSPS